MQQVLAVQLPPLLQSIQEPDLSSLYSPIRMGLLDQMIHLLSHLVSIGWWIRFADDVRWIVQAARHLANKLVSLLQVFGNRAVLRQDKVNPVFQ